MSSASKLMEMVHSLTDKYYKLILLISMSGADKASIINRLCEIHTFGYINLNLTLSEKLKEISKNDRCFYIQEMIDEIIRDNISDVLIIDNIEMIFSKHLQVDPLALLKNISKYRKIIVVWPGNINNNYLTYAEPAHEDYIRYSFDDIECLYMSMERGL